MNRDAGLGPENAGIPIFHNLSEIFLTSAWLENAAGSAAKRTLGASVRLLRGQACMESGFHAKNRTVGTGVLDRARCLELV